MNTLNRRGFLRLGTQTLASGSLLATLGSVERVLAASDTSGYRALVCIFLHGGNDSFNWLVPRDEAGHAVYAASRRNLALDRNSLLPMTSSTGDDTGYGLHPSCPGLRSQFAAGRAAFIANSGPLVQPVSKAAYLAETVALPPQLYSHSDQEIQWMTSYPQQIGTPTGWAGRIADLLQDQDFNPRLSVNISLNGNNTWQSGGTTVQYALGRSGAPTMDLISASGNGATTRRNIFQALVAQGLNATHPMTQQYARTQARAIDLAGFMNTALDSVPEPQAAFPDTELGEQLRMAARVIAARPVLGVSRQMFFIGMGGWDTHDATLFRHAQLLSELDTALTAFQDALQQSNAEREVTTFTASDFGRTLTSNGDGTDHAWGGHAVVVGGAVQGGRIYGRLPDLALDGPDDVGNGRIVPTLSTDEYAATLARWFGVSDSDLDLVFPNLSRFSTRDLGFMLRT